jgi:hypothetical protein
MTLGQRVEQLRTLAYMCRQHSPGKLPPEIRRLLDEATTDLEAMLKDDTYSRLRMDRGCVSEIKSHDYMTRLPPEDCIVLPFPGASHAK